MEEIKEKKCFKCGKVLPIANVYKHKKNKDGYLNKCVQCTKNDVKENEAKLRKDPEWVEKERKRSREKYHKLEYREKYKLTSEKKKETIKRYHQKFPEKALATKYTEIYLTKIDGIHLHHWSYNQEDWLDIIELTIKEHYFLHRYIIYDQERMMYRGVDGVLLDTREKHVNYLKLCEKKYID